MKLQNPLEDETEIVPTEKTEITPEVLDQFRQIEQKFLNRNVVSKIGIE